jgi:hydrogenase maturation factor
VDFDERKIDQKEAKKTLKFLEDIFIMNDE